MKLAKRTYSLPPETVVRFESAVVPGRRSAKVTELMQAWLDERERDALRRDLVEGCRDMSEIYLEMSREWEPLEEEVARALDGAA